MILVDANLLIYAANLDAVEHERSRQWLDQQLSGPTRVGLPWPSLLAFMRISSNPAMLRHPLTPANAWRQVRMWLESDVAWIPVPGDRHADILERFLQAPLATSRLIADAHLAALAVEHGLTLCSADGDFAKFSGLKWLNPLAA